MTPIPDRSRPRLFAAACALALAAFAGPAQAEDLSLIHI